MPDKVRGYLLSPLAERDLEDIWLYTCETWSRDQADRYHSLLIEGIRGIASGDKIGRDASDVRESYRKFSVGRHVLFYRETEGNVSVIRILHESMDIPAHLGSAKDS